MKKNYLFLICLLLSTFYLSAQSTINITTSGGSYHGEKWVNITTATDGGGTQIWGQGNGTQCDGSGLIDQDITIAPGTYYVNCYDQYGDGWDNTLISVTAYGSVIGNNGGTSPDNGVDDDSGSGCDGTPEEFEASFQIVVPAAPSCLAPSSLTETNITDISADLAWIENGSASLYNIEYVAGGGPQGTGTTVMGVANPHTLTGLTASTNYDWYVQADCGMTDGLSDWSVGSFTTAVVPPACGGKFYDSGGAGGDYSSYEDITTVICPDNAGDVVTVTFTAFNTETSYDILSVFNGDDDNDPSLGSFSGLTSIGPFTSTDASGCLTFVFDSDGSGTRSGWEADITCAAPASCPTPTALSESSITDDSANLTWTGNGSSSLYNIEYVAGGGAQGTGTTVMGVANPYSLTGLTASTTYDWYVQADCGMTDGLSDWTSAGNFTTLATPPANDACSTATSISCNDNITGETTIGASDNGDGMGCGDNGSGVWYEFTGTDEVITFLVSPESGFDPSISVSSSSDCSTFTNIDCSDSASTGGDEEITFFASSGSTYYLYVSYYTTASVYGTFDLSVSCTSCIAPSFTLENGANNCPTGTEFEINIEISDFGSATTLDVTYDDGTSPVTILNVTGDINIGPFDPSTNVDVTVADSGDATCSATSSFTTLVACPPANDECDDALALTESTDDSCNMPVSGTTINGTTSVTDNCSTSGKDVWYTFTPSTTGEYNFKVTETNDPGFSSTYVSLFSGSCGALTQENTSCFSTTIAEDVTMGTQYYVNVRSTSSSTGVDFDLCAYPSPPPPANDDCAGAISLSGDDCSSPVTGNTAFSTQSLPGCVGTANDDVWYSFMATSTDHIINISNVSGSSDIVTEVFDGCGGTSLECQDTPNSPIAVSSLTIGNTYYFRIYTYSSTASIRSEFTVCVEEAPLPPANDDACGAVSLTVNSDYNCGSTTAGTLVSATASNEDVTECEGTENDDVWFSFVATATTHRISLTNVSGFTDMAHSLWEGTCGSLTYANLCSDPNTSNPTGLTIGNTYYVRVNSYYSPTGTTTFDICIGTPPSPPANDDACNAVSLTIDGAPVVGSNSGATLEADEPEPLCWAGASNETVWYSFTATEDATLIVSTEFTSNSLTDTQLGIYTSSDCSDLNTMVEIDCDDDSGDNPSNAAITEFSAIMGTTYYAQVEGYNTANGEFMIQVTTKCEASSNIVLAGSNMSLIPGNSCTDDADGYTYYGDGTGNYFFAIDWGTMNNAAKAAAEVSLTVGSMGSNDDGSQGTWTMGRYWNVDLNGTTFSDPVDVKFYYDDAEQTAVDNAASGFLSSDSHPVEDGVWFKTVGYDWDGTPDVNGPDPSNIELNATEGTENGLTYVEFVGVTSFSGGTYTTGVGTADNALPIKLVSFTAQAQGKVNLIEWTTASQNDVDYMEVERSENGKDWSTLGQITEVKNTSRSNDYEMKDQNPRNLLYYRLKSVDYDGTVETFDVVKVRRTGSFDNGAVTLKPNPVLNQATIQFSSITSENVDINIIDVNGRVIRNINVKIDENSFEAAIDLATLKSGVYFVSINNVYMNEIIKFIKL